MAKGDSEISQAGSYDIIIVGAGHAGIEAALAGARMGCSVLMITMSIDAIGRMSCNPAIGGLAKGQITREIDALGGEMGKAIDATGIQFRMLNMSKGPAVQSPRAQADKYAYSKYMQNVTSSQPNLTIAEDVVENIIVEGKNVKGVTAKSGRKYLSKAVIITTGTFLKAIMHCGETKAVGGRINEPSADNLSDVLRKLGFEIGRLKTGTPPRLLKQTIDFSKTQIQYGDSTPKPFSFQTERIIQPQTVCWITYTNEDTHKIIRENLHRAPMYSGQIKSLGPRYCPSIEDKVVRFADKNRHQIFLEPEGLQTDEIYVNGVSTSTPPDVQEKFVHTIEGVENAKILRYGYAVEYDFAPPHQLKHTLETKLIESLYFAGQINGTSGYEEAAGQGLVAGINAALKIQGKEPFILQRHEAYIGVMIDDLVTMTHTEPYRMFTSRAEYRLLLRADNADRRLMPYGHKFNLIPDSIKRTLDEKEEKIFVIRKYLQKNYYGSDSLEKIMRRQEMTFDKVEELHPKLKGFNLSPVVKEQVEIEVKYCGYLERQNAEIERQRKLENWHIPLALDFSKIKHLRNEAKDKLSRIKPMSLGQASRIAGITPADISTLMVYIGV